MFTKGIGAACKYFGSCIILQSIACILYNLGLNLQVTKQHNDDCKRLLRLMGVPVIEVTIHYISDVRSSNPLLQS